MSKWKLVLDKSLVGQVKCPYQVYCGDLKIPQVFVDGNKRDGNKIEFSIFCQDDKLVGGIPSLTVDEIKALPTDKIEFFNHGDDKDYLKACRIWATL